MGPWRWTMRFREHHIETFTTPLSVGITNSGHIINTGGSSRHGQWYWMTVKIVYIYNYIYSSTITVEPYEVRRYWHYSLLQYPYAMTHAHTHTQHHKQHCAWQGDLLNSGPSQGPAGAPGTMAHKLTSIMAIHGTNGMWNWTNMLIPPTSAWPYINESLRPGISTQVSGCNSPIWPLPHHSQTRDRCFSQLKFSRSLFRVHVLSSRRSGFFFFSGWTLYRTKNQKLSFFPRCFHSNSSLAWVFDQKY